MKNTAGRDAQLNVYNVSAMRQQPPSAFEVIRFDPNNDCNVQCVYCLKPLVDPREGPLMIPTD